MIGKPKSSIYTTIAEELNRLGVTEADEKHMLIYSDLREHSSLLNLYSKRILVELKENPETIKRKLLEAVPLDDLDGITVHFIYKPIDANDSEIYLHMVSVYEEMITEKRGTVSIGTRLSL